MRMDRTSGANRADTSHLQHTSAAQQHTLWARSPECVFFGLPIVCVFTALP